MGVYIKKGAVICVRLKLVTKCLRKNLKFDKRFHLCDITHVTGLLGTSLLFLGLLQLIYVDLLYVIQRSFFTNYKGNESELGLNRRRIINDPETLEKFKKKWKTCSTETHFNTGFSLGHPTQNSTFLLVSTCFH